MKHLVCTVLVVLCLALVFTGTVSAQSQIIASGTCGDLSWSIDSENTLTITGTGNMPNWNRGEAPWYADYWQQIHKVVIAPGVTSIGNSAFWCLDYMKEVSIPEGVVSIGLAAFQHCISLDNVILPDSVKYLNSQAFWYIGAEEFTVPVNVSYIGTMGIGGYQLTAIHVASENTVFSERDGCLYNKAGDTLQLCPMAKSGIFAVPDGTTSFSTRAFFGCSAMTEIIFPASVKTLPNNFIDSYTVFLLTFLGDAPVFSSNCLAATHLLIQYSPTRTGWENISGESYGGNTQWREMSLFQLPASLSILGEEALAGTIHPQVITAPAGISIEAKALSNIPELRILCLQGAPAFLAEDALLNSTNACIQYQSAE